MPNSKFVAGAHNYCGIC